MSKLVKEFKEFALRGNMVDLAVGVIIGSAFGNIVNSVVNDLFMPILSLITGKVDFSNLFIDLTGTGYATLAEAQEAGAAVFAYGNFITALINFILLALVVFLLVKGLNTLSAKTKKPEPEAAPTTKVCPFCKSEIPVDATRCPHCTSEVE